MRGHQAHPGAQGPPALDGQDHGFAPIIVIAAGAGGLAGQVYKAPVPGLAFNLCHRLPFRLGPVQKGLIAFPVSRDGLQGSLIRLVPYQAGGDHQAFSYFL